MASMPPLVKLQIQEMKHEILYHLNLHHGMVEAEVSKMVEKAIEGYNFESQVQEAVWEAIDTAIKQYFKLGDGFLYVQAAVTRQLNEMFDAKEKE